MSVWTASLLCPYLFVHAFELSTFQESENVRDWVAQAHSSASLLDEDLAQSIPYIIVAGDQGVGKSTTINRLVQASIFPMRSKAQADKDQPQTTIATMYHIRRRDGNVDQVLVHTKGSSAKAWGKDCSSQMIKLDKLAETISKLQAQCFKDNSFSPDSTITVEYSSPTALDISIVDLPGIQQSGQDAHKTRELTEKWLERYSNSIILAVLVAERQFQQSIIGILEKRPKFYQSRTILVITKPQSISPTSRKVLNMVDGQESQRICNGRAVILRSADTSDENEERWSISTQDSAERNWFHNSPIYKERSEIWGIETLRNLTQDIYLRRACSQIPRLQKSIMLKLESDQTLLRELPVLASEDALFYDLIQHWKQYLERDVRENMTSNELQTHYKEFLDQKVEFSQDRVTQSGLPQFGMAYLTEDHPFWSQWISHANQLTTKVRATMQKAAVAAGDRAISTIMAFRTGHGLRQVSHLVSSLVACDDADNIVKRLVHSYCFVTSSDQLVLEDVSISGNNGVQHGNPSQLDSAEARNSFVGRLVQTIPSSVLRMVIQLCVWEPMRDLAKTIRTVQGGALHRAVVSRLDTSALRKQREKVEMRVDAYHKLLTSRLTCVDVSIAEDVEEEMTAEEKAEESTEVEIESTEEEKAEESTEESTDESTEEMELTDSEED